MSNKDFEKLNHVFIVIPDPPEYLLNAAHRYVGMNYTDSELEKAVSEYADTFIPKAEQLSVLESVQQMVSNHRADSEMIDIGAATVRFHPYIETQAVVLYYELH